MDRSEKMVKSVDTACKILTIIQERDGAGVTEIANELDYAKSAIHKQLTALENNSFVVNYNDKYRLSLRFLYFADQVKKEVPLYTAVKKAIEDLATKTGEVAQFGIEEHGQIVCVYKSSGENAIQTASSIGTRSSLHSTSLGKSILVQMSKDEIDDFIENNGLPEKTSNTITSRERLFEEIEQTRERGYAIDNEESVKRLRCIGAPVRDIDSHQYGALSVSGPVRRMSEERIDEELRESVLRTVNVIEVSSNVNRTDPNSL